MGSRVNIPFFYFTFFMEQYAYNSRFWGSFLNPFFVMPLMKYWIFLMCNWVIIVINWIELIMSFVSFCSVLANHGYSNPNICVDFRVYPSYHKTAKYVNKRVILRETMIKENQTKAHHTTIWLGNVYGLLTAFKKEEPPHIDFLRKRLDITIRSETQSSPLFLK